MREQHSTEARRKQFIPHTRTHTRTREKKQQHTPAMKTRIACYFDVPGPDNRPDFANYVDVRVCASRHPSLSLAA